MDYNYNQEREKTHRHKGNEMSVESKFIEADQNWHEETTTYWFELSGKDYGTGYEFDSDVYGVVERGNDEQAIVDADNNPLTQGDYETIAVSNSVTVTDEIRKEAACLSSTLLVDAGELYDLIHMHGFAKAQMIASGNQEALEKALHWIIKETTFDNRQYGESWKEYALREAGLSMIEMYP